MRTIVLALTALLFAGGVAVAQAPGAAELKKLEGRWLVAHRHYTPSTVTDPVAQLLTGLGHVVEIRDGKLSARDPDKAGVYLTISFDSAAKPKAVDLKGPGKKDQVLLGIYSLENDVLSLEIGTGKVRPTSFMNPEDQVLLVLKRAPK
jgi:uncharacterized protein (TIGR03067 family)